MWTPGYGFVDQFPPAFEPGGGEVLLAIQLSFDCGNRNLFEFRTKRTYILAERDMEEFVEDSGDEAASGVVNGDGDWEGGVGEPGLTAPLEVGFSFIGWAGNLFEAYC